MKILYVTTILGTIDSFLIPHIQYLIQLGNEVSIACETEGEEVSNELRELGCPIHQVSFKRSPFNKENIKAYKQIQHLLRREGFNLIHVHTPVAAFITRLAARNISNVSVLYTAHGFHFFKGAPKKNNLLFYGLERLAANWTDGVITMNNEDFEAAQTFSLRRRDSVFKVHGVGLNLSKFKPQSDEIKKKLREEYHYGEDDFILINVGELSYRKHQDLVIKAVGKLKGHIQNIKLLLVGSGEWEEDYRKLVKKMGLEREVIFLGYRTDIHNLMILSDLAVTSSRHEGLPVNVMEAMASGLPIVASDVRGNHDLVKDGINGFVFGVDDVGGCAATIERIYYSEELRKRFSTESSKTITSYSQERVLEEMEQIYEKYLIAAGKEKIGYSGEKSRILG